ncbi:TadE family protein [Nocardia pseudobrasiliensis]|uniref:TadE-like domain-containing protein n=1 Tax=Nocardia pseudobrasiliensis TaxID=45979 RepID=A0A370I5L6_9NOCA|nr:TadE family protein [Nocardia pseudobrasiliensis]RDI66025.1 hypothetical protein DFR76_105346 [Nocardia pseudobrasiliensis]
MSPPDGEAGAVTIEAAIALTTLIAVVVLCLAALMAASAQIRCVDAAREAARSGAQGADALRVARRIAPPSASLSIRDENDLVIATATARVPLFPLLVLHAEAVAVREPGVRE